MSSAIQSVIFDKSYWTIPESRQWLKAHRIKPLKRHTTKRFYRYRIHEPSDFQRIRTKKTSDGLDLLIGFY